MASDPRCKQRKPVPGRPAEASSRPPRRAGSARNPPICVGDPRGSAGGLRGYPVSCPRARQRRIPRCTPSLHRPHSLRMTKVPDSSHEATVHRLRLAARQPGNPQGPMARQAVAGSAIPKDRLSEAERLRMLEVLHRLRDAPPRRSREEFAACGETQAAQFSRWGLLPHAPCQPDPHRENWASPLSALTRVSPQAARCRTQGNPQCPVPGTAAGAVITHLDVSALRAADSGGAPDDSPGQIRRSQRTGAWSEGMSSPFRWRRSSRSTRTESIRPVSGAVR